MARVKVMKPVALAVKLRLLPHEVALMRSEAKSESRSLSNFLSLIVRKELEKRMLPGSFED